MHFGILPEHAFGPESPWYARGSCFRIRLFGRIAEHAVHAQVLEEGATPWSLKIFMDGKPTDWAAILINIHQESAFGVLERSTVPLVWQT